MAKVTEKDKEILSIIFKRKLDYFNSFDDNMELIDLVEEYKEEEFTAVSFAIKSTCYAAIAIIFIIFYINVKSLHRLNPHILLSILLFIPGFLFYIILPNHKSNLNKLAQLFSLTMISVLPITFSMITYGLLTHQKLFLCQGIIMLIYIPLLALFKRRGKKKDKLFDDIIENLKTNEKYLESLTRYQ